MATALEHDHVGETPLKPLPARLLQPLGETRRQRRKRYLAVREWLAQNQPNLPPEALALLDEDDE